MAAPLDPNVLDAQTGGDADLRREVLALFVDQAKGVEIQAARPAGATALADDLHRLQGSARAVGARHLDAVAAVSESALRRDGRLPDDAASRLRDALQDACRFAAALLAGLDDAASPNPMKADKHLRPSMSHPDQPAFPEPDS